MTKPIDTAWRSYAAQVLPPEASEVQRLECRRAFFSGALIVFRDVLASRSKGNVEGMALLGALDDELRRYADEIGTPAESPIYKDSATAQVPLPANETHRDAVDCLHCRISAAIAPAVHSRSINDVLGSIAEVVGELLAGVADRNFRRQLLRGTSDAAWSHAGKVRRARVADGVPDLEVRQYRVH